MVYDFTNPIYILLMILLFGVPIVTPVIYGQYRSTTTGFDLEGQLMLGPVSYTHLTLPTNREV